ncbi:MAG: 3-methyl-2-oxobutanoate hydroxymethyltransferase [Mariprofundaceae bacterium]|nr:3-methyl-2-oxobutanoate hydroxymethyltransferase [Mariprofundaceae bacterium]
MKKVTAMTIVAMARQGKKTVWLTAHDASSASLASLAGVDVILVGDSLAMTTLGYATTLPVSLAQMIAHATVVVAATSRPWVVCDLPFGSYQTSPEQAYSSSVCVLQQSGCDAVKLEGGVLMAPTIRFLSERGIPVVAHIGLMPQSVKQQGGYRRQGEDEYAAARIKADAQAVSNAGALAVVLECIPDALAAEITATLSIPTVGIGAGAQCDAQILVWHDLLGLSEKNPPFAPAYLNLRQTIVDGIAQWADDVRTQQFPGTKPCN